MHGGHGAPTVNSGCPFSRHLAEQVDATADVFASLGVMSGRRQQGEGTLGLVARVASVELADIDAEMSRRIADLVERHQNKLAVAGRVLHALGGRGGAELLQAKNQVALGEVRVLLR